MTTKPEQIPQELKTLQTKDEILTTVSKRCREILPELTPVQVMKDLQIFIVDYGDASDALRGSVFYTDNCKAILSPPTIVVNADFLLELETAFRSFDLSESLLGSQYLRSDEDLFGLVLRIRHDPANYLARLRQTQALDSKRDRAYLIETLTLVSLFFILHEIGHLKNSVNARHYATFLSPEAQLEDRLANAVVKLCRHADEFAKFGFGLPGAEEAVDSTSMVRKPAGELAKQIETLNVNHTKWFGDEISADHQGTAMLIEYLDKLGHKNPFLADQYRYISIKGLFTTALYTWYRDLLVFGEKIGLKEAPDGKNLFMGMIQDRKNYIHAASLFGDVHRFTFLRAVLTMESILRSGSDFLDRPDDSRSIWWAQEKTERKTTRDDQRKWWNKIASWKPELDKKDQKVQQEWWLSESLQRYYLLCIHMDTAVKFAFFGCASGWMEEADRVRKSPQLFAVNFESIQAAVQRLRGIP